MGTWPRPAEDYLNPPIITSLSMTSIGPTCRATGRTGINSSNVTWPAANKAVYIPFVLEASFLAVKMFTLNGSTTDAGTHLDAGVYDSEWNLLVSNGSVAQTTTAGVYYQVYDIADTLLLPGLYYFAYAQDGTTGKTQGIAMTLLPEAQATGVLWQSTAFPLPSTATPAATADLVIPVIGMSRVTTL